MATGDDILGYKGNPALGFGADGIAVNTGGADFGKELGNVLENFNNKNFNWNVSQYNQAIKDRDHARDLFAQQDIDFPIEETDRAALIEDYDKMKEIMLADPTLRKKHTEFQQVASQFANKRATAQARNKVFIDQRKAIADEVDPERRKKMIDHLEAERSKGVNHLPEPYLNELDWDPKNIYFMPAKKVVGKPEAINRNGILYKKQTMRPDMAELVDYYEPLNWLQGERKTLPDEAAKWSNYAMKEILLKPDGTPNEEYLGGINKILNQINIDQGWTPENKRYLSPVFKKTGEAIEIETDPVQLLKKVQAARIYKDEVSEAPDKELQEAYKTRSETNENNAQAGLAGMQSRKIKELLPYEADLLKANAEKARKAGDMDGYKLELAKSKGSKPVSDVVNSFDEIDKATGYKPASEVLKTYPAMQAIATQYGIKPTDQIYEVPMNNIGAIKMLSTSSGNGKNLTINKPSKMYAVRSAEDPNNLQLIGIGKGGGKMLSLSQGINEMIKHEAGYDPAKVVEMEGAAKMYVNSVAGQDVQDITLDIFRNRANGTGVNTSVTIDTQTDTLPAETETTYFDKVGQKKLTTGRTIDVFYKGGDVYYFNGSEYEKIK